MIYATHNNDTLPPDTKNAKEIHPLPESLEGYVYLITAYVKGFWKSCQLHTRINI